MLKADAQAFTPKLKPVRLPRFFCPRPRRRIKSHPDKVLASCPWARRDGHTLYECFNGVAEHLGGSIPNFCAVRGKSERDGSVYSGIRKLVKLGLAIEVGIFGRKNLSVLDRSQFYSERGQGQRRYRLTLDPRTEAMLAELETLLAEGQTGPLTEALETKLNALAKLAKLAAEHSAGPRKNHDCQMANGTHRLMLNHGHLSYKEIVRRYGVLKLANRLDHHLVHEDNILDFLGLFRLMGCDCVPPSRGMNVTVEGRRFCSDGRVYCSSPAGSGFHNLEFERSHLGPEEVRERLKRYLLQFLPYPVLAICLTDRGARHFDDIGQELGVPVVATSIPLLHEMGFEGEAWLHQGQRVSIHPVAFPS